jgi:hypothetical protein
MTLKELEARLASLEAAIAELRQRSLKQVAPTSAQAWLADAGVFRDDPEFWEAVRIGREYRESLRPGRKRSAKQASGKKHARP